MDGAETLQLALRVAISLACVLGLLMLVAKGAARRGGVRGATPERFSVVGRASLGKTSSVALVRVGDRALVVGVSETGVRLLG